MSLALKVIGVDGEETHESYLLRAGGWTEERYFEEAPETRIVEFEDGDIIVPSPASVRHQEMVRFLTFLITGYVGQHQLGRVLNGPAVVRLRPSLDYEPDIFFIGDAQLGQLGEQYFSGAPAMVIEVVSQGSRDYDLKTKACNYRDHGVQEYWAVDAQEQMLHRHLLPGGAHEPYRVTRHSEGRVESPVLAGFWLEASWLWRQPLPMELACLQEILGAFT